MARTFNGTTDFIAPSIGAITGEPFTVVAILRPSSITGNKPFITFNAAANIANGNNGAGSGGIDFWTGVTDVNSATQTHFAANEWSLVAMSHAVSGGAVRFHSYRYSTGTWIHEGTSTTANITTPTSVRIGGDSTNGFWPGDIAIMGVWNRVLTDAEVENLPFTLQPWFSVPSALWPLDQSSTSQAVPDLSGGGANQSSITGTTVSTNSVPVFSYGAPVLPVGFSSGGAPAFSSTMAASARPVVTMTAAKGVSGTLVTSSHPAVSIAARKGSTGTLTAQGRPSAAMTARKGVNGTLSTSAKPVVAVTATKAASGALAAQARPSVAITARKGVSGTLGASARPSVSMTAAKGSSGTLASTARPVATITGAKNVTGTLRTSARPVVSMTGSSAPAFVGTMGVVAHPVASITAGPKGAIGALSATGHPSVAVTARKGASGAMTATAHSAVAMSASLGARSTLTVNAHPFVAMTGRHGATGTLTVVAYPRVAIVGTLFVIEHADHVPAWSGRIAGTTAGDVALVPAGRMARPGGGILLP